MYNKIPTLFKTYLSKWLIITFLWLVLQQIIAASSTLFLTKAVYSLNHGYNFKIFIYLYLLSLLLPYLPGSIARLTLSYNITATLERLYSNFITSNYNRPLHFLDTEEKDKKTAMVSKEYLAVSQEINNYLYEVIALSLNILLNFIAIIIWVDRKFFIGYLCSLLFCIAALKIQKKYRERYNEKLQSSRISLTSELIKSWDNIIIGNKLPFNNWKKSFFARFGGYSSSLQFYTKFSSFFSVLISFITFIPIFIIIIMEINGADISKDKSLILISIIPRIFLLLNNTEALINKISYLPGYKIQVNNILSAQITKESENYSDRIKFDWIIIKDQSGKIINCAEFFQNINQYKTGLFKISGSNGSGKTSLLMLIKNILGDEAFVLPAHHNLQMITNQNKGYSTGEKIYEIIKIIFEDQTIEVLLLDEWDANLDMVKKQKIIDELQELSKNKLIIAVSHKTESYS